MKKVFKSDELFHVWAHQKQSQGRNSAGNVFFRDNEIYSYGFHFCMGKVLNPETVLITNRSYSNTTAKHLHAVRFATNHIENVIFCAYPEKSISENLRSISKELSEALEVLSSNRRKQETKERAKVRISGTIENAKKYFIAMGSNEEKEIRKAKKSKSEQEKEFSIVWDFSKSLDFEGLKIAKEKIEKSEERKRKAKQKKNEIENAEKVEEWKNGNSDFFPSTIDKVYLRLISEDSEMIIQTSKGVTVKLENAKILFQLIQKGLNVKGFDLEGYLVISMNGVLKIGCHEIERTEIERFAKTQNWI